MAVQVHPSLVAGTAVFLILSPTVFGESHPNWDLDSAPFGSRVVGWHGAVAGTDALPAETVPIGWGTILTKLTELRRLNDGWYGDASLAPSSLVLDWLAAHHQLLEDGRNFAITPVEDGSVSIAWSGEIDQYMAELRPDFSLYTFVDHQRSDDFKEATVPLTEAHLRDFLSNV